MYALTVAIRLIWSISAGMIFFAFGLVLFLLLDIFKPNSDAGYKLLNRMYKLGSLGSFKGLRMEHDNFSVTVEKRRQEHQGD